MEGDVEKVDRSIPSSVSTSPLASKPSRGSGAGVKSRDRLLCCSTGALEDVGVFAGEDLVGEIDLARSGCGSQPNIQQSAEQEHCVPRRRRGIEMTYQLVVPGAPFSPGVFLLPASCSSPRLLDLSCRPIP